MTTLLDSYLAQVQAALRLGNATEHTYRPALKQLLEGFAPGATATNEPRRVACGAPDFIVSRGAVPLGYVEAKDVGVSLDKTEKTDQLRRYRAGLRNLVLTDCLDFYWYVDGERRMVARLATRGKDGKTLRPDADGAAHVETLLTAFLTADAPSVATPRDLAERMAALARIIRDTIRAALEEEAPEGELHAQMNAFREVLLHDLAAEQFADMYAQTIAYGLFAARVHAPAGAPFTRQGAAYLLPKTNPFLRRLFSDVAGPGLDARIEWAVNDLAELLHRADMAAILRDFGQRTRREDPVVHFYETFLAAYDPRMREIRGVYYTPEPVVSYIVRSVDHLLQTKFDLPDGLADTATVCVARPEDKGAAEYHRVQILDPATGTGTFLHAVVERIRERFAGNAGMWSGYVAQHLLPRLWGFELLMAPYAVAHLKLGLQLAETGYDFSGDERLGVYLTNTLDQASDLSATTPFLKWLTDEARAAAHAKREVPVMVVLGNPPYSGISANMSDQIAGMVAAYKTVDGQPLGERKHWLQDDYVKFIRFGQTRIEQTGHGILAFVTNHGYLDNPTFRGMRRSLMTSFDDLYLLDLHGNTKKRERAPDGGKDENVFDIQQGVAIGIFVRRAGGGEPAGRVHHAEIWGERDGKYRVLGETDVSTTAWREITPAAPHYLFAPQDTTYAEEYERGRVLRDVFVENSVGIVTARDSLTVLFRRQEVLDRVRDFVALSVEDARAKYDLGSDVRDWKVASAQQDLRSAPITADKVKAVLYRPFDERYTFYTGRSRGFIGQPQQRVMAQMLSPGNLGLITSRSVEGNRHWEHIFCTSQIIQHHTVSLKEVNYLFPLYLYPTGDLFDTEERTAAPGGRRPNLSRAFIADFAARLGLEWVPDGMGDRVRTFGPEDVFHYAYAIFHAPGYRERYAEFLRRDFPRLPLTTSPDLFRELCALGAELTSLHLLRSHAPNAPRFPVAGDNLVGQVRYTEPGQGADEGRVWINETQFFAPVPPTAWSFHVGGYQVARKWLKDRKGRQLSYDDLTHYGQVIAALMETARLMARADEVIERHGGWPLAGS